MINRILIVNDNQLERQIVIKALQDTYHVEEAGSGEEAFAILENMEFDVIILDNVMEYETGYDVAKQLRQDPRFDNTDLVLMSSNDSSFDELEAFESGFSAYLLKSGMNKKILSFIRTFERKQKQTGIKVLVVDDSRIIRAMISNDCRKEGLTVKTAESGEKAVQILKEFKPDFITMDVEMPGLNGFQTSKIIKTNPGTSHIPIVMISATDTVQSELKGIEAGVAEYFIKPFPPKQLINFIKEVKQQLDNPGDSKVLLIGTKFPVHHIITYTLNKEGIQTAYVEKHVNIAKYLKQEDFSLFFLYFDEESHEKDLEYLNTLKIEISNKNQDIPVIAITSSQNKYAALEAFKNGADDYLSTPFCIPELLVRVNAHLHKNQNCNSDVVIDL